MATKQFLDSSGVSHLWSKMKDYAQNVTVVAAKNYSDGNLVSARSYSDGNLVIAKGYTDNKIAALVGSAPETLDTLKELADALDAHEDEYGSLLEVVGKKLDTTTGGTINGSVSIVGNLNLQYGSGDDPITITASGQGHEQVTIDDVFNQARFTFPTSGGTIALTSDITKNLSNYLAKTGGTISGDVLVEGKLEIGDIVSQGGMQILAPEGSTNKDFIRIEDIYNDVTFAFPTSGGTIALTKDIPSLSGYATESWVNNKNYLNKTEASSTYIARTGAIVTGGLKLEYTSGDDFTTITSSGQGHEQITIDDEFNRIRFTFPQSGGTIALTKDIPSLSGYATESWVNNKGYLTSASATNTYFAKSNLVGYQSIYSGGLEYLDREHSQDDTTVLTSGAINEIVADLYDEFAQKSDIPTLEGLTNEQINAAINY